MPHRFAVALALVAMVLAACSPVGRSGASPQGLPGTLTLARSEVARMPVVDADARAGAAAINGFALDLYRTLAADGENLVFSPTSISLALGMARLGAKGATATEIDAVLHGATSDDHAAWLSALDQALAERNGTFADANQKAADVALNIANASFAQAGFPLEQAYLDAMAARFDAGLQLVDFGADPESARVLINAWVAERTEQRIPELLAPGVLDELTRLALVNAIYLKAQWHTPFSDDLTEDAAFTTSAGTTVMVPMMSSDIPMAYGDGDGWRAVELPYVGEELAMTIIVPDDLATFEAALDGDVLDRITGSLVRQQLVLTLPRFSVDTQAALGDDLASLGMPTAFTKDLADFTGMSPLGDDLYLSAVIHQANIDVDEYGTEAAAATAVIVRATSGPPPDPLTLNVDRPFIFAVRDTLTGAVLFLGRVTDPSIAP